MSFRPISASVDLPAVEHEILTFWADNEIFHKTVEARAGELPWSFYEGPPTANAKPALHHLESRVFKDIIPRFKTMQGFFLREKTWAPTLVIVTAID